MLSHIFDPIYLDSIVVGDLFEEASLERALYGRLSGVKGKIICMNSIKTPTTYLLLHM
jgi:hypothetical protein